jgi:hypothetical protein
MITIQNYFEAVKAIDLSAMPETLRKSHAYVEKATDNGANWQVYHDSDAIRKVVDIYLQKLNEFESASDKASKKKVKQEKQKQNEQESMDEAMRRQGLKPSRQRKSKAEKPTTPQPSFVERIPEELRFIKRFLNLDGKTKTKEELLRFINSLQKAIIEKRIRKTSPYADEVRLVQSKLIEVYNSMKAKIRFELSPDTYEKLKALAGSEKVLASIGFIKRYIGMNGKGGMKEKAKQLLEQINRALDKGRIGENDPYTAEIHEIKKNLKAFTSEKTIKTLEIEKAELNGLEGILGCACHSLSGLGARPAIMNSMDFVDLDFPTLGFRGKWLDLIGDPSPNFTAMVFGRPKMGKSYLCIDFAGYLARSHGRVLYVAKEEGLDATLQKKLAEKDVAHPNLSVASILPADLSRYDFIFLDSVTRLGLNPEDLRKLRAANPTKSFIFIFQTTKDGKFRGENAFQHDVDVVIEVPERGKAVGMGRFGMGGEVEIFNETQIT